MSQVCRERVNKGKKRKVYRKKEKWKTYAQIEHVSLQEK